MPDQDPARQRIVINERSRAVLQLRADSLVGHCEGPLLDCGAVTGLRLRDLVHPDDRLLVESALRQSHPAHAAVHHRLAGRPGVWVETVVVPGPGGISTVLMSDMTAELGHLDDVREAERRVRSMIDVLVQPCAEITADGHVTHANGAWREATGGARHIREALRDAVMDIDEVRGWSMDRSRRLRIRWTTTEAGLSLAVAEPDDAPGRAGTRATVDVIDAVTGLLNRAGLAERWAGLEPGTKVAVILMDLAGFRSINEQHGMAVGDIVLHAVGERFRSATRPGDVVARLAGDEFVLVCRDVADPFDLISMASRLRDALEDDVEFDDPVWGPCLWPIAANLGAVLGESSTELGELLRQADESMHHDRNQRRAELIAELDRLDGDPGATDELDQADDHELDEADDHELDEADDHELDDRSAGERRPDVDHDSGRVPDRDLGRGSDGDLPGSRRTRTAPPGTGAGASVHFLSERRSERPTVDTGSSPDGRRVADDPGPSGGSGRTLPSGPPDPA
jgi:diguanylate cyclase (GGDEF)-like protein